MTQIIHEQKSSEWGRPPRLLKTVFSSLPFKKVSAS
jgi:hypothetical protein